MPKYVGQGHSYESSDSLLPQSTPSDQSTPQEPEGHLSVNKKDFSRGHSDQSSDVIHHPVPQTTVPDQGTTQEPVAHLSVDMGDENHLPDQLTSGCYATQRAKPSSSVGGAPVRSRKVFEVDKTRQACNIVSMTIALVLAVMWVLLRIVLPRLNEWNRHS
ncbi:uncharacterized protein [Panulirus ornatus]|uniref:uncharacterized protein n=1 Tax=Panulirus ornatus TaxID=150431 RepID=UPI003A84AFBD